MTTHILDTNVLLRSLVRDNEKQFQKTKTWFKEAEQGKRKLIIQPLVVAETCFVLESFYKKSRNEIATVLQVFLSQRWLDVQQRNTLLNLWKFYIQGLHFVDSFLLSFASLHKTQVLTFDKKMTKNI